MHYYDFVLIGSPLGPLVYRTQNAEAIGSVFFVPLQSRQVQAVIVGRGDVEKRINLSEIKDAAKRLGSRFSEVQRHFAAFIADYYFCSFGEALALFTPFSDPEQTRDDRQWAIDKPVVLSEVQTEALRFLQRHRVSLLFVDTGSGKTEIYMKYFEQMLERGKRSLFLMPEISLTPQMQRRLEVHFGDAVVMWHSKLTKKQKEQALEKIRRGEAGIIA